MRSGSIIQKSLMSLKGLNRCDVIIANRMVDELVGCVAKYLQGTYSGMTKSYP